MGDWYDQQNKNVARAKDRNEQPLEVDLHRSTCCYVARIGSLHIRREGHAPSVRSQWTEALFTGVGITACCCPSNIFIFFNTQYNLYIQQKQIVPVMNQLRPVASCAAVAFHKGLDSSAIRRETCDHPQGRHVIANLAWHGAGDGIFLQLDSIDCRERTEFGGNGSSEVVVICGRQEY